MPRFEIVEHQQFPDGPRAWVSDYRYVRVDRKSGLHIFEGPDGELELFAKRKDPPAHWHLRRGKWAYEFCRGFK